MLAHGEVGLIRNLCLATERSLRGNGCLVGARLVIRRSEWLDLATFGIMRVGYCVDCDFVLLLKFLFVLIVGKIIIFLFGEILFLRLVIEV